MVGHRLGSNTCHPHICVCRTQVDARGLHGLACKKSGPRYIHHAMINDIIWRTIKNALVPASNEPFGLSREDAKRSDGATLIPWARGKPMAWNVTVPDTYTQSHLASTSLQAGTAADNAAIAKKTKLRASQIPTMPHLHTSSDRDGRIMECRRTNPGHRKNNHNHQ